MCRLCVCGVECVYVVESVYKIVSKNRRKCNPKIVVLDHPLCERIPVQLSPVYPSPY